MAGSQIARVDVLRSLPFSSITSNYAKLGSSLNHVSRIVHIQNLTDGDMIFAFTSGNTPLSNGTADNLIIAAGGFVLFDLGTNREETNTTFAFSIGTQVWVRESTTPTQKSVYLSSLYGQGE